MQCCRYVFLCLLLAIQVSCLKAQQDYLVQRFTTDNGLPSNGIKGLAWDENTGFLWIATEAGITRYNGADFKTFSKVNTPEIFSERMLFLLKNREGRIYASDEAGNIFYVMQNKLPFLAHVPLDTRPSSFRLVGLAASGRMFRQSSSNPAPDFGFNFQAERAIPLNDSRIILFHKDSLYDYRYGNRDPRLICATGQGARTFCLQGKIFILNARHEFYLIDPDSLGKGPRRIPYPSQEPQPSEKEALFWQPGMACPLLIAGSRAWALEYNGKELTTRLICNAIPTDVLLSYAEYDGARNILFLGTNSTGILVIRKNVVHPVKKIPSSPGQSTAYYSQLRLSNQTILTNQGDILGGAPPPLSIRPIRTGFNNFLFLSPDSLLWYSHEDTIFNYAYKTGHTTLLSLEPGSITDGFAESGNRLYIANAIGIGVEEDRKVHYLYRHPQADINQNAPFAMMELKPGVLVIACCNGLLRFDTKTLHLDTLLHPPGTCIRALWKYKDYLFIGTYGKGIYLWKNGVVRSIPSDKNNYLQYAHCFIPDRRGFCWISTNKGLFRARPEDLIAAYEKEIPEVYYHYYGRADGMDITELNGGCTPCALQLNDSTVSFPSMDGLVWTNPDVPLPQPPEGSIYVDDMFADGKRINTTSLFRPDLPSDTRELTFQISFPSWVNKENIYVEYRLEPYSKEWQLLETEDDASLHFSNLPPGDYQLYLRKLNGFGKGNYSYTTSTFRIRSHWYQQAWALLLGLCCLIAAVIGIVWLRTRQFQIRQNRLEIQIADKTKELQQKNEELEKTDLIKTRLISIISHDLVTPLKFIHLAGKSLIEKQEELTKDLQRETVTEITNTAKELEFLSTNILNWIKYRNEGRRLAKEHFDLHQLTDQLFSIFNAMARQKKILLINHVEEGTVLYQYIEPVRIMLYNLILNGINFTSEGHILVDSQVTPEGILLSVKDTGVGMTSDQINNIMADHFIISSANVDKRKGNGLGYLIIKDLLKIIRGRLSIHSEKNKGTQVTIRLPDPL
jgi:signal transduction histidine kinase